MSRTKVTLCAIVLALLAITSLSAASYTISLSGSVSPTCSLTITINGTASALPITTKVVNSTIATVVEKSNSSTGYTVTLSSANGWLLLGSSSSLAYTLAYGGTAVSTASAAAGVPTTITDSTATTPAAGTSKNLAISFDGSTSLLPSGDYSDTLTVTIASK